MNGKESTVRALLLYCRPGFEKECVAELIDKTSGIDVHGYAKTLAGSGYALFHPQMETDLARIFRELRFDDLIFARQWLEVAQQLNDVPTENRIPPILQAAESASSAYCKVVLETADTNDAKQLSIFLRKFAAPLEKALRTANLIKPEANHELHLFFQDSANLYVGLTPSGNCSPWPMGIHRLKFPRGAPSRSTLKLEEAFLHFLGKETPHLQPAMTAVDLGAAPGGWTWQLVRRSIRVTAVDNGPMDAALLDSGIVQHLRADGFRYRPPKPVDWLVCDMVEQPSRIADLVARWLSERQCRHAIFNLKLPMKKRYEEVMRCREIIETRLLSEGFRFILKFKQLYHDREEVTGYCNVRER